MIIKNSDGKYLVKLENNNVIGEFSSEEEAVKEYYSSFEKFYGYSSSAPEIFEYNPEVESFLLRIK